MKLFSNPIKSLIVIFPTAYRRCIFLRTATLTLTSIVSGMLIEWIFPFEQFPAVFIALAIFVVVIGLIMHEKLMHH